MDSFEWEPARQNDPIYFDFLLLGPVALLLALLVSGQPAIRQKLEEPDSWQKVKPQLSFIRAIPECPEGLRSACDKCITLIDQPPATSFSSFFESGEKTVGGTTKGPTGSFNTNSHANEVNKKVKQAQSRSDLPLRPGKAAKRSKKPLTTMTWRD